MFCPQVRGYNLLPFHVDKQTLMLNTIRHILMCASSISLSVYPCWFRGACVQKCTPLVMVCY